jgi:eukaryotic-like serine/threonine-protein kinase
MPLTNGTKLGPYEIISPLGAGGMGEVYRARDTRLDRTVAIKVLPESLANDADRLQRFEQEARVLSTVNHPNLLAIYDVGAQSGTHYLVSEFLEGQTLREAMGTGPLSSRKVSEYGLQIANGLSAAHDKGIVHRDLKPENIFVTHNEHVKILDFGLAKLAQGASPLTAANATLTSPALTAEGTVMGTVGYMSPEQVRGQAVDHRADIFSFGAILYEMGSGKRAFKGDSGVETMNAILKEDPPEIDVAQLKIPPGIDRIARHCLEKNPANRFQSARDLSFAIGALSGSGSSATLPSGAAPRNKQLLPWLIAALMGAIALMAFALFFKSPPSTDRLEFTIPIQEDSSHLAISPDGRMFAFVSRDPLSGVTMLRIQRVGSTSVSTLSGTEGASYPFWSPDDAYIGFFADGKLKKIPASGGVAQVLAAATYGRGGTWGRKGVIIYSPQATGWLWRVNADGTNSVPLTDKIFDSAKEGTHRWPVFLPDGEHFLFLAGSFTNPFEDTIYFSSLTKKERSFVVRGSSTPGYANGQLFYADEKSALRAIQMDVSTGVVSGEPLIIANQIGYQPSTQWAAFSVSENGTVVYNPSVGASLSLLTWYDRSGKELGQVGEAGVVANPNLSPDGSRVVMNIADVKANNINVWISDFNHTSNTRFTFDTAEDDVGVWSRDGAIVAYRSTSRIATEILLKQVQGLSSPTNIFQGGAPGSGTQATDDLVPNSWSLDDKQLLCSYQPGGGGIRLALLPVSGGKLAPFLTTKSNQTNGQISPDGKWVAYASDESGDWEIYATSFPSGEGKWQISRGGGTEPRWRGDGKEIYYIGGKATLTAVPVNTEGGFSTGSPTPLFQTQFRTPVSSTDLFGYDVAKDGQRFLVNRYTKPPQVASLHIILNATSPAK